MNKYEKLFLKQARLGYSNLLHRYHDKNPDIVLRERQHLANKDFVFSDATIKRLSDINTLLTERSEAAYEHAEKLECEILALMKNPHPFILDYEIEFEMSFFAEQKYAHVPSLEGNPFFECRPMWFMKFDRGEIERREHKEWLFKTDHRENIREGHPINGFCHCYLFHDLIDHTILSYQDIVDIEDIWLEVVLTVQNYQSFSISKD
jgi:hypothetical protein